MKKQNQKLINKNNNNNKLYDHKIFKNLKFKNGSIWEFKNLSLKI